jgi:hypothetical protein
VESFPILVVVGVVADYIFTAYFRRLKKATFVVTQDTPQQYAFQSDVGGFRIDRDARKVFYAVGGKRAKVSFDEIKRLKLAYADNSALFEELFFGFDVTDLMGRYQDSNHWYTIQLELVDGSRIPLFTAGQHQPREFLLGWYITLQERLLERFGAFRDVHEFAGLVLDELRDAFKESKCEIRYS